MREIEKQEELRETKRAKVCFVCISTQIKDKKAQRDQGTKAQRKNKK